MERISLFWEFWVPGCLPRWMPADSTPDVLICADTEDDVGRATRKLVRP